MDVLAAIIRIATKMNFIFSDIFINVLLFYIQFKSFHFKGAGDVRPPVPVEIHREILVLYSVSFNIYCVSDVV